MEEESYVILFIILLRLTPATITTFYISQNILGMIYDIPFGSYVYLLR